MLDIGASLWPNRVSSTVVSEPTRCLFQTADHVWVGGFAWGLRFLNCLRLLRILSVSEKSEGSRCVEISRCLPFCLSVALYS